MKLKNTSGRAIQFDYESKEKILLPGQSYELENSPYIDGLIGNGLLTEVETPETQTEAEEVKQLKPKR